LRAILEMQLDRHQHEEGRSECSVKHGGTHASVWGSGALSASIADTQPSGPRNVLRVQN
jgi:hypothetical protein